MGFLRRLFGRKSETITRYRIVQEHGNGAYIYNGKVYKSDIVQACLNPYVKAIGKLCPRHIRRSADSVQVNPEPYMRFLLEEPNTLLTMQKMLEMHGILELVRTGVIALERGKDTINDDTKVKGEFNYGKNVL